MSIVLSVLAVLAVVVIIGAVSIAIGAFIPDPSEQNKKN